MHSRVLATIAALILAQQVAALDRIFAPPLTTSPHPGIVKKDICVDGVPAKDPLQASQYSGIVFPFKVECSMTDGDKTTRAASSYLLATGEGYAHTFIDTDIATPNGRTSKLQVVLLANGFQDEKSPGEGALEIFNLVPGEDISMFSGFPGFPNRLTEFNREAPLCMSEAGLTNAFLTVTLIPDFDPNGRYEPMNSSCNENTVDHVLVRQNCKFIGGFSGAQSIASFAQDPLNQVHVLAKLHSELQFENISVYCHVQ